MRRARRGLRLAEVGLAVASVLLCLLLGEAVIRVTSLSARKPSGYAPVRIRRPERLPINPRGYRDVERAIPKPGGVRRVLSLGDSFAWGASIEYDDTYAQRVERALCRRGMERWEVVQLANPGMGTVGQAAQLEAEGFSYQPDVVVLGFVLNDAEDDASLLRRRTHDWQVRRARRARSWLLTHSAFFRFVRERIDNTLENRWRLRAYRELYAPKSSGWITCQAALTRMGERCHAHGTPLVVMVFPLFGDPFDDRYPFTQIHEQVARAARASGAEVLDLLSVYRGLRSDLLVVDGANDEHPNEIAHRIAAHALLRTLDEVVPVSGRLEDSEQ